MWDLPGLGLEPVSPALAGGFLTTAPPGKPCLFKLKVILAILLLAFIFHLIFYVTSVTTFPCTFWSLHTISLYEWAISSPPFLDT